MTHPANTCKYTCVYMHIFIWREGRGKEGWRVSVGGKGRVGGKGGGGGWGGGGGVRVGNGEQRSFLHESQCLTRWGYTEQDVSSECSSE